jgi:hypothetical protein
VEDHLDITTDIGITDEPPPYKPDSNTYDDNKQTLATSGRLDNSILSQWITRRRKRGLQSEV